MELLSSIAKEFTAAPFPAITQNLDGLKLHRSALWEDFGCYRECPLSRESELFAKLNMVEAMSAELKTSLDASASRVHCSGGELARLKAAQSAEV